MPYNKEQVQELGRQIVALGQAVSDGVDVTDVNAGMDVLAAFMGASDEFQADLDAAVLDMVAGMADAAATLRQNPPTTGKQ
jgi:hypothetical protein